VLPLVADLQGLRRFATAVSTPGSPQYGDFASIAALSRRFGAPARRRAQVLGFLRRAGARRAHIDATGLFAAAVLPAGTAQRLFGTRLARFHSARAGTYTAPAAPVRIPAALRGAVSGIVGLDTRPVATAPALLHAPRTATGAFRAAYSGVHPLAAAAAGQGPSGYRPASGTPAGCAKGVAAGGFTPSQYLTAYGYDPLHAAGLYGQGERVALIEIDGFKGSDIRQFASCFGLHVPRINGFGVGLRHALAPGGESTLDLEILDAAAPGLKSIDVYESSPRAADVLLSLTAPLDNRGFKPQVISASLGLCESSTKAAVHGAGISAAEGALEEAAASGISVLAASGDDGSSDCVGANNDPLPELAVNFPASSPWVTGVGGTNVFLTGANTIQAQIVWNDTDVVLGAGGGGESELFNRPSYQARAWVGRKRAVPDVALLSDVAPGYDVYCSVSGECISSTEPNPYQTVGGTSAATPLLAGGLALVDQELRLQQRQSLGLVNPLLYAIGAAPNLAAEVLADVSTGQNDVGPYIPGWRRALGCCLATAGYDPASGWGGLNVAALEGVALATQPKIVDVGLTLPGHQRPLAAEHILARVSCSGRCLMGAFARISIGPKRAFTNYSSLSHLSRRGSRTIRIPFSRGQLSRLRGALRHHRRVTALVYGAIVDPGGNVERRTRSRTLRITG
jgi:kumamolisin